MSRIGAVTVKVISLLSVGIFLAGLLSGCGALGYKDRTVRGAVFPVPHSGDVPTVDLLITNWSPSKSLDTFYASYAVPDGAKYRLLWEVELAQSENWSSPKVAADEDQVYYVLGANLAAFRRTDGSRSWETPLSDLVWSNCPSCLHQVGDQVIALTMDYVLQGIAAAEGTPAWSVRLNDPARAYDGFMVMNEEIVLIDRLGPDSYDLAIHVFNPATGAVLRRIAPTCPDPSKPYWDDDEVFFEPSPAGRSRAFILYQCQGDHYVQNWDLLSGELRWQEALPEELSPSVDSFLFGRHMLYLGTYEGILGISLESGRAEMLAWEAADPDYKWLPLAEHDGILLGWAERTRGSSRHELWALDSSGALLWRYEMTADTLWGVDSGSADWAYWLVDEGVTLIQVLDETDELRVVILDLQTGQVTESSVLGEDYAYLDDVAWGRQQAFLTVSGQVYTIDLQTATITATWP